MDHGDRVPPNRVEIKGFNAQQRSTPRVSSITDRTWSKGTAGPVSGQVLNSPAISPPNTPGAEPINRPTPVLNEKKPEAFLGGFHILRFWVKC
jgi:hypothetical protein